MKTGFSELKLRQVDTALPAWRSADLPQRPPAGWIKAIREGRVNLRDSYARLDKGEVWLLNLHISPYEQGNRFNHEATRTRKLLLHAKEIRRLIGAVERQGLTLVATEIYFKKGRAKVRLALARGKKLHDKRADLREKDDKRDMARALKVKG